jgi:hypothetical protein
MSSHEIILLLLNFNSMECKSVNIKGGKKEKNSKSEIHLAVYLLVPHLGDGIGADQFQDIFKHVGKRLGNLRVKVTLHS